MAIAFDAVSSQFDATSQPNSFTHTPVGTPKGVYVADTNIDGIVPSSVTYGGVALTMIAQQNVGNRVASSWFLGEGIPTGAQTVSVNHASSVNSYAVCITVTAGVGKNTATAGTDGGTGGTGANPSVTVTGISGASFGFGCVVSDVASPASITAGSGMTIRGPGNDFGSKSAHAECSTSEQASGDMTVAFTCAQFTGMSAIAIEEVAATSIKTVNGLARASVKTYNGLAIASIKSINGLQ